MLTVTRFIALWLILAGLAIGVVYRQSLPTTPYATPVLRLGTGVNVALEDNDAAQRAAVLDAVQAAGFTWVRQRIPWEQVEPAPGEFRWEPWDALIADVAQRGLTLVAVLDGSPAWARTPEDADNPLAPPARPALFGPFARAFSERYRDQVHLIQVWDEPNIAPHWGNRPVAAAEYTALLREAAVQIRDVHPAALILLAALAPNTEPGGLNQNDIDYLAALYAAGAAEWFDIVAGQAYGFDQPPQAQPTADALNFRRPELLRTVMTDHGDGETPLWVTAFGWHAGLDGQPATDSPWQSVDEATQALWAVEGLEFAHNTWPWLGGIAWVSWQPAAPPSDPRWGFALQTPENRPRPALTALSEWLSRSHPLGPGAWPLSAPALTEAGGWRRAWLGADPPHLAQADNNRLTVPFHGAALALDVQSGPFWAYLDVSIDGQPANALPRDPQGRANLVLYDPLAGRALVMVARDLANGPHVAEIVAVGGWDQWPLRQVVVWGNAEPAPAGRWPWGAWGLVVAGLALLALSLPAIRRPAGRVIRGLLMALMLVGSVLTLAGTHPSSRYAVTLLLLALALGSTGWLPALALLALLVLYLSFAELPLLALALTAPLALVTIDLPGRSVSAPEALVWLGLTGVLLGWLVVLWTRRNRIVLPGPGGSARIVLATGSFRRMPLDWPVAALLAVSAVSLAAAAQRGVAIHELRTVIVAGALAYVLVRLASPLIDEPETELWSVVWGIGLGGVVVAVWGIAQALTGAGLITAEGVARVRGPYGSPNNLALYLSHSLPLLLATAALAARRDKRRWALLMALPMLAALLLTFSKGGLLLGLPAALLVMGLVAGGRWRWVAPLAVVLGGLLLLPLFQTERFASLLDLQGGTTFFRLQLWRGAWNMIQDHPWLGVGLDNFLYAYRTTYVLPAAWQELNLSHPHNILLDFWTRLGVLGVAVGGWLFVAAFAGIRRSLPQVHGDKRAALIGLLGSLVATLVHGLIDNSVFLPDLMILFMLTLGLIARVEERKRGEGKDGEEAWDVTAGKEGKEEQAMLAVQAKSEEQERGW